MGGAAVGRGGHEESADGKCGEVGKLKSSVPALGEEGKPAFLSTRLFDLLFLVLSVGSVPLPASD